MFNNKKKSNNRRNGNKIQLKRVISFIISYSLIFNNLLYASSSIVVSDDNKETKVYNPKENEDTIIIDIAKPFKKVSLNIFKLFNTENKKIVVNNSNRGTKSKLLNGKEIEANDNYGNNDSSVADTIVFLLEDKVNNNNTTLSSTSFEVLGTVNNFIFLGPNYMTVKGLSFINNISKLILAAGASYIVDSDVLTITNDGKISLLPTEDENHLALDTSEINELNLLAREIDISGETIVKGLLAITTGLEKNNDSNNNKPKYSFQASSFGNIQASSIKLINLEENIDINISNTSIVTTIGNIDINLKKGNLLLSNTKVVSEQSTLDIKANYLKLNDSSTLSSAKDMTLTLKGNLINNDKSVIHTEIGGNITIETNDLKNVGASVIHSGRELRVNGKLLENIGVNVGDTHSVRFIGSGLIPRLRQKVRHGQDKVDVTLTTDPSQILAEGNIKLNVNDVQNRGSNIVSKSKLMINGTALNNERLSFNVNVRYETKSHWKRRRYLSKDKQKYGIQHFSNPELFYSNAPSLIMGDTVEINLTDILTQDAERMHDDKNFVESGSRIEATNDLIINSKRMLNKGIIISSTNKEFITVDEELDNIGGVIVSKKGGKIKSDTLINKNLIRQFSAEGVIFTEEVQPAIIGTSADPKQLAISCGKITDFNSSELTESDDGNRMIMEVKKVENIGSYLVAGSGTMEVIADKFKSTTQEIRNRIEGSGSVMDVAQNFESGILGNNIELNIKDTAEISGTKIEVDKLKLKAKQLALEDVKNKYYEESIRKKKGLFSRTIKHTLTAATQSVQTKITAETVEIETEDDIDMTAVVMNAKDISIESKNGNVNIEGTTEGVRELSEHGKETFGGLTGSLSWKSVSIGVKKDSAKTLEAKKDDNIVSSFIRATGSFFAKAKGYFRAKATDIDGDNIDIEAMEGDVIIESMLEKHNYDTSHEELTTVVSFKVGNSYVDVAATSLATAENLERVKEALDTLNHIREEYEKGRASKRVLADATENFALMTANAGMSTTQILKAVSSAAATTASGGFYVVKDIQVSGSRRITEAEQTKHVHSQINGNNINIKSGGNTKIKGSIKGKELVNINAEGDISLESTQDINEYYANQKQLGFTAGMDHGSVALGSKTSEHSSKYTKQTSINSEGDININTKGNLNLKGAAITNNDEDRLNINVNSITHEDMENEEHHLDTGINFNTGFGDKPFQRTTTIGITDKENKKELVTRSTISKGNVNVKEGNIDGLNRDAEKTEKVTRDEILSANDFEVTVDNRLLTEEGREQIKNDIANLPKNVITVGKNVIFNPLTTGTISYMEDLKDEKATDPNLIKSIAEKVKQDLDFDRIQHKVRELNNIKDDKKLFKKVLEEIVKDIGYNKGKDIEVVLYNDVTTKVEGYSVEDGNRKIIAINVANNKDNRQLIKTLFHESYDYRRHSLNENQAKRYANHVERVWDNIVTDREPIDLTTNEKLLDNARSSEILEQYSNKVEYSLAVAAGVEGGAATMYIAETLINIAEAIGVVFIVNKVSGWISNVNGRVNNYIVNKQEAK